MKQMHVPQSSHNAWIFLIDTWTWFSDWQARLLVSPIVHARTNTIFKVMKVTGIPHCDGSPNYFWNELCGSVEIFANLPFFLIPKGVPGAVLMSPNAIGNFSLWWHKWNTLHHAWTLTISAVPHDFQSSGGGLNPLLQTYAPHYSLQSRCNLAISVHLFPFSAIQHSHRDVPCQQKHICLTAVHNWQHFQAPFQESVWQHVLQSPHYHEFCKRQAKPSMHPHVVYRALPWPYSLPPVDGQHSQEGQPYRCNVPILSYSLWPLKHNSTCLHPRDLHGYKLTKDK